MRTRNRRRGFSLIDVMLTIALVGLLASIAVGELNSRTMVARRTEAVVGLTLLWKAQQEHLASHGRYAGDFSELAFQIEGGTQLGSDSYRGKLYTYQLSQPWGESSFYCIATAQLDGDPWPDILEIFETGEGR
ncbi:MAG: prepilin-type N-terminal cleavage/methylation domain-containing protein [Myxococcus sp.]|nr:prepilin-type N-terminal cleavage/methylation domain-containing protein [Myxococcus sp.]